MEITPSNIGQQDSIKLEDREKTKNILIATRKEEQQTAFRKPATWSFAELKPDKNENMIKQKHNKETKLMELKRVPTENKIMQIVIIWTENKTKVPFIEFLLQVWSRHSYTQEPLWWFKPLIQPLNVHCPIFLNVWYELTEDLNLWPIVSGQTCSHKSTNLVLLHEQHRVE